MAKYGQIPSTTATLCGKQIRDGNEMGKEVATLLKMYFISYFVWCRLTIVFRIFGNSINGF